MSKIWFTSDQHFGHTNILHLCKRPFKTIEEMDQALIDNWNAVVHADDTVYVLGDFTYKAQKPLDFYTDALKGKKILIRGNHDHKTYEEYAAHFDEVRDVKTIMVGKQIIVMFHYPILSWYKRARGSWHLYGHVHNAVLAPMESQKSYNVGVDTNAFTPIEFDTLKLIMDQRVLTQTDQHKIREEATAQV